MACLQTIWYLWYGEPWHIISIWKCDLLKGQTNLPDFWTSWKIQRLNPGFLIDFSRTPQLVAKHGGSWSCSYLLVTSKPTNQPPFWGHGISASGITIETSRLPGLGRKTPWLSYQQTGDEYTKKMAQLLEVFEAVETFPPMLGSKLLFITSLEATFANADSASSTSCFYRLRQGKTSLAQVSPKPEFRLVSANHL